MRKALGPILLFLGAFFLTVALLAVTWAPGQVKRTPLDTNSVTRLSGVAQLNSGDGLASVPVKATSTTHADSKLSTDDVILFQNSSCLLKNPDGNAPDCVSAEDPDKRLIAAGTDTFATNRRTGVAVNDFKNLPADAGEKSGLVNKFPFDVEKKTYPFWDGYVGKAVDAVYQGQEQISGLTTYKFLMTVTDGDIEIAAGVPGKYSVERTMWIEPATGAIIKQSEHQVRKDAASGDVVIDLNYAFTDDTVSTNVKTAKDNRSQLTLLTRTVPIIALILGILALVGGVIAVRTQPRPAPRRRAHSRRADESVESDLLPGETR